MTFEKVITVETTLNFDELDKYLRSKKFEPKKEYDIIDKYMAQSNAIINTNYLDTLNKCVIIREMITPTENRKMLMYKYKKYNLKEEVVKRGKIECDIISLQKAEELLNALTYYKLIDLRDHVTVYANDKTELHVQEVNNKHIYIEMETECNYLEKKYLNRDDMIKDLLSYNIPIKADNFFVKKAEIELREKFENDTNENLKYIGKILDIKTDRELGSKHPKHGFIYSVNYGYVPNTVSGDNEELDCYLLGVFDPVKEYKGKVIAVIHRTNDNDDKLVVVPEGTNYTNDQINALVEFQEKYFKHVILR